MSICCKNFIKLPQAFYVYKLGLHNRFVIRRVRVRLVCNENPGVIFVFVLANLDGHNFIIIQHLLCAL